jgi:hypothetical protein
MPGSAALFLRVFSTQQNPGVTLPAVPFAAVFDTELSRKWNVSRVEPRRRKRNTRAWRG